MPTQKAGAIVLSKDNPKCVLVMFSHSAGYWGFPKGHIEENEKPKETVVREVNEETGLDVELISDEVANIRYYHNNEEEIELHIFVARSEDDTKLRLESDGDVLEWVDYRKVGERLTYDNLKEAYKKILPNLEEIILKLPYPS